MKYTYLIGHWLTTLIFAPFLPTLYELLFGKIKGQVVSLLEVYPVSFLFSLVLSIPTLIIYYFIYKYLLEKNTEPTYIKLALIIWTVLGITTSFLLLGGQLKMNLIYSYSIVTIISGLMWKIDVKQIEE